MVVSLGITADSYIVFYERLKDEVRHGKTMRMSVQPASTGLRRHIVAGGDRWTDHRRRGPVDLLVVGSVGGFAFDLGIPTFLDPFVVYFEVMVFYHGRREIGASGIAGKGVAEPCAGGES